MSNISETPPQLSSAFNKFVLGLLSSAVILSVGTLATVWQQSALIEQRVTHVDNKYIDKSARVLDRLSAVELAFGQHLTSDSAHQLMIQKEHLNFMNFMDKLDSAHVDIESIKHELDLMQQGCCKN